MNIRNYFAALRSADSNDGAAQQQNTQQVEEAALPPPENNIAHEQEAQQHTEDQMEANHFEEQEDEVTDDSWEDIPLSMSETVHEHGRKATGIVKEQMEKLKRPREKEIAEAAFRRGQFWCNPPKRSISDIHTCWKDFYQMKVFNWFPDAMMPLGWKLSCPNCGDYCKKNGKSNPSRLVFGMFENYILNAPQRYECMQCLKKATEQKNAGVAKKERTKYTFLSTDFEVLAQIEEENPALLLEFPCTLSAINGIDNELMDLIVFNASKSIGPSAMSDMLLSFHEKRWNEKEIKWLAHMKSRILQPLPSDRKYDRDLVEKCPSYFSEELCGSIPSSKYLVLMFNRYVTAKRQYFDSEVLKCCKRSTLISLDASYKVGKLLMKYGKEKMYDTLHTMVNEFGQIVQQKFSNGDSHDELEENLAHLNSLGLDPSLVFTDNPERGRSMLLRVFPKLSDGINEDAFRKARTEAGSSGNPILPTRGKYIYLYKASNSEYALKSLMEKLDDADDGEKLISIDAEWPVYISEGSRKQGKLNHLIMTSNIVLDTYIFELYSIGDDNQFMSELSRLFKRDDVSFVGCCHKGDITRLRNDYPKAEIPTISNSQMIDVRSVAISRGVTKRGLGKTTLQYITHLCGYYLLKDQDVRVGETFNSRNGDLRNDTNALEYMQRDVEAPLLDYLSMKDKPILTKRMTVEELEIGQIVEILASSREDTEPIAIGRVEQVEGNCRNGINLSKGTVKRCYVKIFQVCRPKGIVHFPRAGRYGARGKTCACGRFEHGAINEKCDFYCYEHFGPTPFHIVETVNRMRIHENQELDESEISEDNTDEEDTTERIQQLIGDPEQNEKDSLENNADDNNSDETINIPLRDDQIVELEAEVEDVVGLVGSEDNDEDNDVNILSQAECEDSRTIESDHVDYNTTSPVAETILHSSPLEALIASVEKYDYAFHCDKLSGSNVDDHIFPDSFVQLLTRVLGDAFHVMDRIKVHMHHDFKSSFFRAIRAAIFVLNPEDVRQLKAALRITSNKQWNKLLAFNFKFVAQRVRRRIPDPDMLYERLKAVFDYFADKCDSKTRKPLFNALARQKANSILVMVKSGLLSDPPGYSFYVRRFNKDGSLMVDRHGLQLYRSIRGTSNLESLHQTLSQCFGHTYSGAWYSDSLLTLIRHQHNWRASIQNDKDFPKLHHYDGTLFDKVNDLYEFCFGVPKYKNWISTNDSICTTSPFGIVRIDADTDDVPVIKCANFTSTSYISHRQGSPIGYLPVRGVEENTLFRDLVMEAVSNDESLGAMTTFIHMAQKWNERARGKENGIFKKQVVHLIRKYKNYKKLRSKEDAMNNEEARALLSAVEHVPNIQQNLPINDEYRNPVSARDLPNPRTSTTANITELGTTQQIQRKKRKSCDTPGCVEKYGDICPKKYSRRCKLLEEQGVTFERMKRKAHIRSCANPNCFDLNCKANNNRMRCIALLNENTS